MSLLLSTRTRVLWPPLKRVLVRPAARAYRVHRHDKRFERYWQRLMRRHRRFAILRRLPSLPRRIARRIPSEFGDQAAYRWQPTMA